MSGGVLKPFRWPRLWVGLWCLAIVAVAVLSLVNLSGLPPVPDFHGGDDNFTAVSYMPIPSAVMQTLATLIFDGVFDRYPRLKWGAIELGASWVPGWMRSIPGMVSR